MTRLINRIKRILKGQRGESLMESIASILIFTLLMLTVATMIRTSLRITEYSTVDAAGLQDEVNKAVLEQYDSDSTQELILRDAAKGIEVEIPVTFSEDETFTVFAPQR